MSPTAYLAKFMSGAELTEEVLAQTYKIYDTTYHRHPNGGGLVAETARVDDDAYVDFFSVVHNHAVICENTVIYPGVTISGGVFVGADVTILSGVMVPTAASIRAGVTIGTDAQIRNNEVVTEDRS